MFRHRIATVLSLTVLPLTASAQQEQLLPNPQNPPQQQFLPNQQPAQQQYPAPVGLWRCVMNSIAVSIDVQIQADGAGNLFGQGLILYNGTRASYRIRAPGRWMMGVSPETGVWTYQFALQPSNHAAFSLFTEPTDNPSLLYQFRPNQTSGGSTETSCQRG